MPAMLLIPTVNMCVGGINHRTGISALIGFFVQKHSTKGQ